MPIGRVWALPRARSRSFASMMPMRTGGATHSDSGAGSPCPANARPCFCVAISPLCCRSWRSPPRSMPAATRPWAWAASDCICRRAGAMDNSGKLLRPLRERLALAGFLGRYRPAAYMSAGCLGRYRASRYMSAGCLGRYRLRLHERGRGQWLVTQGSWRVARMAVVCQAERQQGGRQQGGREVAMLASRVPKRARWGGAAIALVAT